MFFSVVGRHGADESEHSWVHQRNFSYRYAAFGSSRICVILGQCLVFMNFIKSISASFSEHSCRNFSREWIRAVHSLGPNFFRRHSCSFWKVQYLRILMNDLASWRCCFSEYSLCFWSTGFIGKFELFSSCATKLCVKEKHIVLGQCLEFSNMTDFQLASFMVCREYDHSAWEQCVWLKSDEIRTS